MKGILKMADIKAFKALRFKDTENLENLVAPPYDIISPEAQKGYYEKDENNVIRLEYGYINENDTDTNNRYTRAQECLNKWLDSGVLKIDEKNSFYIYEEIFNHNGEEKSFKGIFARVRLEEFEKKVVLPHEETLSKAKQDRFLLMEHTDCNFSPIYLLYLDEERKIVERINENSKRKPDISFMNEDGVLQNLWVLDDEKEVLEIEKGFINKQLFIADGHHRYETALNFRNKKRQENPDFTGEEGYNFVMSFLIDMDNPGLIVFPTHRMLKELENFSEDDILDKLSKNFIVEKINDTDIEKGIETESEKIFGFYTGKDYYYKVTLKDENLTLKEMPDASEYYRALDVSVLHSMILEKYFGIDKENMAYQKNLVYTRSYEEAIKGVKSGEFQCSFIINATKIRQIKDISQNNEKMPQKSTYFWPKLVTGIVMNKH